ncbi:glucomannan 4-beta-mannosyltransferase 1-like isoform X2 [Helianthus annuus]|uniref:glucomannan 4-beta-mannosyltransferase 1-like isoform X2 n=1 Tax=Helianthus annuus TaxID=4232 RepID=UPI0016533D21|nr:glucomannan 4-beta-mannosyltransferase 1-like isoform X2 [Helianthus annuus]XP_035840536.1 glucomannan 4-beta-mannosyltransferase 1-like isoform X2 [Helianthus annuus]XP_035840547.1 glucomannan 4-beta-mannosyltransferase 1-like isoform X2 [Helianthus annuus]XP_035840558.1 glucomannan 4-beta-mannosyltransferase 1-like isoform X2 [Helianthus annuus]XP_035840561.1 glucomannan 4-beta-mannosyltransferase 1-like isoform X2 [Helianthus annuus]XP_035840562.1 glucomannan 4-beta-mannosyltransferase 1
MLLSEWVEPTPIFYLQKIFQDMRVSMVIPPLTVALCICMAMSIMMFIERVYMTVVVILVKIMRKKRYTQYNLEALKEDLEQNRRYPMVLVQIPMFNEKEVYKLSIGSVCSLTWPSDRLIVQVLDDSTNDVLRTLVEMECKKWIQRGVNVKYETRNNRNGYKAGALREGLNKEYVSDCEFVVIFDADFQPDEEFLWRTVPYLLENPELALVQARWKFVNANECIMTRLQEMSLAYHFAVEQEVGSSTCQFFGFNGTAGVWRIKAIEDAGGWKDRTTVEDMDLAVRASLKGWKFVFVGDLEVKNELPSTFKAYRYQQHRWSCGPANLFRKMTKEIIFCERVSFWKKLHVLYAFFFVRKIIAHWVTFFFYCVIIPISIMVPEVKLPKPIAIYIPATITILNSACTLRSLHLLVLWILFENVMSFHRSKATIIGLLGANRVNEWVVTEKLGNTTKPKCSVRAPKRTRSRLGERLHFSELIMGLLLLYVACYDMIFGKDNMFIYLLLQSSAFFVVGVGYVGISTPN